MLGLVGVNVGLAFRHDEDAIAAQSALVLFAIGSSAGAVYGELGIAVLIVLAMALMHGLACYAPQVTSRVLASRCPTFGWAFTHCQTIGAFFHFDPASH